MTPIILLLLSSRILKFYIMTTCEFMKKMTKNKIEIVIN